MSTFKVELSCPGEFLIRGIEASDYQDAVEKAEARLIQLIRTHSENVALPSPRGLELDSPLQGYAEQLGNDQKVLKSYHLEWTGAGWKIERE